MIWYHIFIWGNYIMTNNLWLSDGLLLSLLAVWNKPRYWFWQEFMTLGTCNLEEWSLQLFSFLPRKTPSIKSSLYIFQHVKMKVFTTNS